MHGKPLTDADHATYMAIRENIITEDLRSAEISKWQIFVNKTAAAKRAKRLIEQFDLRCKGALCLWGRRYAWPVKTRLPSRLGE